jgi:hypothetical protein
MLTKIINAAKPTHVAQCPDKHRRMSQAATGRDTPCAAQTPDCKLQIAAIPSNAWTKVAVLDEKRRLPSHY